MANKEFEGIKEFYNLVKFLKEKTKTPAGFIDSITVVGTITIGIFRGNLFTVWGTIILCTAMMSGIIVSLIPYYKEVKK